MMRRRWTPLLIALAVGLIIGGLRVVGFRPLDLLELRSIDYRFYVRGAEPVAPEVVIVAIDNASLREVGRWPWSRAVMATLIDRIAASEPAVIGVDLVQSEATASCQLGGLDGAVEPSCRAAVERALDAAPGDDARFASAVRNSQRTVLGYFFDFDNESSSTYGGESTFPLVQRAAGTSGEVLPVGNVTQNLPEMAAAARGLGFFNFRPDKDGLYRHAPLAMGLDNRVVMPLSIAMLQIYWPERAPAIKVGIAGVEAVRLGDLEVPVDERGQVLLNYRGGGRSFPHVSAADVLAGRVAPDVFRDKLVLLGVTAIGVFDIRAAPFDPVFPGVELHATVLDNMLRADFLARPAWLGSARLGLADLLVIFILAVLAGLALLAFRGAAGAIAALGLLIGYLVISQWMFVHAGIVLEGAYPVATIVLAYVAVAVEHYIVVDREKRQTRRMLDLYLSPALARHVSDHPEMLKLGGEKSERTVLFSDIKNFTSISEGLDPHKLVELLNAYLGDMTDIVFSTDGMLDKYIGDGVMAVWGAPVAQADHAARACRAALAMVEQLDALNTRGREHGWPLLRIRIGLNSGPMVFGNMGSHGHLSLTVMGDAVNLGARLEGISKLYGTTIIASESTVSGAGDTITTRELDMVRVRGKDQAVRIYEVLGPATERERLRELIDTFESGLRAYRARQWQAGAAAFQHVLEIRPSDGPADLYNRRCQNYMRTPPPDTWDAVTAFAD